MSARPRIHGHSPPLGRALLLVPAGGALIALGCGALYSVLRAIVPLPVMLSLILVILLGIAVGNGVGWLARLSDCRAPSFARVCGALLGLVAMYSAWVVFEGILLQKHYGGVGITGFWRLFVTPNMVLEIAVEMAATTTYKVTGQTYSGAAIWLLWGGEIGIVVIAAGHTAGSSLKTGIYCEVAKAWCREWSPIRLSFPEDESVLNRIREGDLLALASLAPVSLYTYPRLNVLAYEAPEGGKTHAWKAMGLNKAKNLRGEITERAVAFTPIYHATAEDLLCLKHLARRGEAFDREDTEIRESHFLPAESPRETDPSEAQSSA